MIIKKWTGEYGESYRLERNADNKIELFINNKSVLNLPRNSGSYNGEVATDDGIRTEWFWLIADTMQMLVRAKRRKVRVK